MRRKREDRIRCGAAGRAVAIMVVAVLWAGAATSPAGAGTSASGGTKAQARKALLVLSDLPKGWATGQGAGPGSGSFTGAPQLASCIGEPTQLIEFTPPQVDSPQFQDKNGGEVVENSISIYPSAKYAQEEYAALSSHKTAGCISALFNHLSGSGSSGNSGAPAAKVSVRKLASPGGTAAFAIDTAGSSAGTSTSTRTETELLYFVRGKLSDAIDVLSFGSPPPPSFTQHLLSVAQSRL